MARRIAALLAAHLALAAAQVPTTCGKFSVGSEGLYTCTTTMSQGITYNISTSCATVVGSPILRLLDSESKEVAYNDGYLFCGPTLTPAALEYKVECFAPTTPEYILVVECFRKSTCSGDVIVALSARVPPEDCGAPKPPPAPLRPSPPPRPPTAQCTSFAPPTSYDSIPIVATPDNTFVYARTEDCPTSCGQHCEAGCFFCSDSGVTPGTVPDPAIPDTQFGTSPQLASPCSMPFPHILCPIQWPCHTALRWMAVAPPSTARAI
jgi:hypothetical protein